MNARFSRLSFSVVLVVVVALGLLPAVQAQEGPKPEAVGLRPDAPPYALHGPYWVGTREFEAETDFHPTTVAVWYPALNPDGRSEAAVYRQMWRLTGTSLDMLGHAIENAAPDVADSPYPLIIFAHGINGVRFASAYLCEHLASYGFVVLAVDYADSLRTVGTVDAALSMFTRPKDVSWQIDYADQLTGSGGSLEGMIDTQHVAVVGHSYGGYTALAAAGAQLDLSGPTSWCVLYPDLVLPSEMGDVRLQRDFCDHARQLANLAGLETIPAGPWPYWGDARVDAIVPLAPGPLFFGSESAMAVIVTAMVLVGSKDRFVFSDFPLYQPYVYENLGSTMKSLVKFENADHMIFGDDCDALPLLTALGAFFACSDPVWNMDRAHDLINHFTTAFLLATLKGDTDAAAALTPEAVSFPGITYEEQGF